MAIAVTGAGVWALPHLADSVLTAEGPENAVPLATAGKPPVIGEGPLVRVLEVRREGGEPIGYEPFTGQRVAAFSDAEIERIGSLRYVIQRYGYTGGARRTLSLTFDDGPDPRWTPQLLDLLSAEHVPATFFDIGSAVARYPDLARRTVREGHQLSSHSLSHVNVSEVAGWRARIELTWTERVLRDVLGRQNTFFRLPYEGDDEESIQETLPGLLRAQRLGLVIASHDFDSLDWEHSIDPRLGPIPLPDLHGQNVTMLLHDGGGNRQLTLEYVARLIRHAKAHGYTFTTMATAQRGVVAPEVAVTAGPWDRVTTFCTNLLFGWPLETMEFLLLLAMGSVGIALVNCALAGWRRWHRHRHPLPTLDRVDLPVSVVLAAYNEEGVIELTLDRILASNYPLTEVLVVDDGSTDDTAAIVARVAARDPRVRLIRQRNGGKSAALNNGLRYARAPYVVSLDADTVLTSTTVFNLVRHFAADHGGNLGAVAGVVRVGNRRRNLLTRWQALEYLTQIAVERAGQDVMRAIAIVPGACAAWRKEAILSVGGYSHSTLAEDCDLSLSLHKAGWQITQDDEAVAYTEAPENVDGLLAQRTRWTYGTLQAIYKHRDMLFRPRYGWLGSFVLPNYVLSVLLPVVFLPLTTVMAALMVVQQGWGALGIFFVAFSAAHVLIGLIAVLLMRERKSHLVMVPIYRLVFEPLRAYLLYTSMLMALRGVHAGWNKLARTGSVDEAMTPLGLTLPPHPPPASSPFPAPMSGPGAARGAGGRAAAPPASPPTTPPVEPALAGSEGQIR